MREVVGVGSETCKLINKRCEHGYDSRFLSAGTAGVSVGAFVPIIPSARRVSSLIKTDTC